MLFLKLDLNNLKHVESIHGFLFSIFDSLMIKQTCLMHLLNQLESVLLALLICLSLSFDIHFSFVVHELGSTLELGKQMLSGFLNIHEFYGGIILNFNDPFLLDDVLVPLP